jgi:plasmid stabilization system protein ParE
MRRVIWTARARDDLQRLQAYIAIFKPIAAERLANRLINAAESLVDLPERGGELGSGTRVIAAIRPYLIRYRITGDLVVILSVRHAARRRR